MSNRTEEKGGADVKLRRPPSSNWNICVCICRVGILLLFLLTASQGCVIKLKRFRLPEEKKRITIFDRYKLNIHAGTHGDTSYLGWVDVEFINTITDTTGLDYDTFPVLNIDSFCIEDPCLSQPYCTRALGFHEWHIEMAKRGVRVYFGDTGTPYHDLIWAAKDYLAHQSFVAPDRLEIPDECERLTMRFTCFLFDRKTGEELARESVEVLLHRKDRIAVRILS